MSGLLAYIPMVTPLPVWDYWAWLLIPLCAAVSVVYKTIKCRYVRQIPRESLAITIWILLSMAGVALAIQIVYFLVVDWGG
jgi:hypothetical protein